MIIKPILQRLNDVPKLTPNPNWLETVPTDGLLIIDGDNVRGKTKFRLSKEQLCLDICNLLHSHEIAKKGVIIYFDHGFVQQAFPLPSNSDVIISFSGMHVRADDVIARDLPWIVKSSHSSFPITVVTEDAQLRKRCKKGFTQALRKKDGSKDKNGDDNHSSSTINRFESFEIISSSRFIDNMYEKRTVEVNSPQTFDGEKEERINSMALLSEINEFKQTLESYRHLQHLQAELSSNPIYLNINNKRNKQLLKQRILGLQKMLDIHESDSDRASSTGIKNIFERGKILLQQYTLCKQRGDFTVVEVEDTWERAIYSEALRLQLLNHASSGHLLTDENSYVKNYLVYYNHDNRSS